MRAPTQSSMPNLTSALLECSDGAVEGAARSVRPLRARTGDLLGRRASGSSYVNEALLIDDLFVAGSTTGRPGL
jgi:hypothetical protein